MIIKNKIRRFFNNSWLGKGTILSPDGLLPLYSKFMSLSSSYSIKTKQWLFFFWWIGAFKHLASPTGKHTIQTPFMLTVNAPSSAAKHPTKSSEILSADSLVPPFGTILKTLTGTGHGFYWESTISNRSRSWVSCVCWIKVRIKQFIGLLH